MGLNPPLVLFGAFDRHNLGDLLFPHLLAARQAWAAQRLGTDRSLPYVLDKGALPACRQLRFNAVGGVEFACLPAPARVAALILERSPGAAAKQRAWCARWAPQARILAPAMLADAGD